MQINSIPPATNQRRSLRLARTLSSNKVTRSTSTEVHVALPLHANKYASKKQLYSVWNKTLKQGKAIGCTPFTSSVGTGEEQFVTLICKLNSTGHRGLFAGQHFQPNATVALGNGNIQPSTSDVLDSAFHKIHNTVDSVLVLHRPTTTYPANLANTGGNDGKNNCRITHACHSEIWRLVATKHISPGEEILTPYGTAFTADINKHSSPEPPPSPPHQQAARISPKALVQCTFCKQKIQLYKLQAHKRMCGLRHR
jgi:hypothetical protein